MLDYEYIKNHYKLIAADLKRQKKLYGDPKAIQHIEVARQLKKPQMIMVMLDIYKCLFKQLKKKVKKKQKTRLIFSHGSVTVL